MLVREILAVYSDNDAKPINTLCGQNAGLLIVRAGGTYSYYLAKTNKLRGAGSFLRS
jgi:hypothetical protein